nr:DEAD/DEAH box helicase [Endozoicomonas sp. ONNA1]
MVQAIETEEDLKAVEQQIRDAHQAGAEVITLGGEKFNVSNKAEVEAALKSAQEKILNPETLTSDSVQHKVDTENTTLVVGIAENDEQQDYGEFVTERIKNVSYSAPLDFYYLKRQPFPHQLEGIRWLLGLARESMNCAPRDSLHGALLADDMGLGKTYMSLVGVSEYYRICREQGTIERPVMVVAPLSLLENWKDEVDETFHNSPFEDVIILQANADLKLFRKKGFGAETKAEIVQGGDGFPYSLLIGSEAGTARLDKPKRLVLTSYQTLRDYQFSLCQIDWSFVIFDEAQFIKSPNTLATRAAKGLKACFKLLATGTPVENHLGDFWCLMDTAKPGALGSYQDFRKQYMIPIAKADASRAVEIKNDIGRSLRQRVGPLMLRRLKEDNLEGLPDKHIWVGVNELVDERHKCLQGLAVTMRGEQLKSYDDIVQSVIDAKTMDNAQGVVLSALMKLRAVSLHPQLIESSKPELPVSDNKLKAYLQQSAKMVVLLQTLDEIRQRQEKVIIFSINTKLQLMLARALERVHSIKVSIINGDTKAVKGKTVKENQTRKGLIQEFEASPGFGVIIMSPVAAGMGLTVVGANNVIHLERHWNPAKEAQASDRVYRIGQKKNVNIYLPMALHPSMSSFDDNLHKLLCNKTTLKDAVVTPEDVKGEEMASGCFG